MLVFTAFSDTAEYLYKNLHAWAKETYGVDSALVSGSVDNQTTYRFTDASAWERFTTANA